MKLNKTEQAQKLALYDALAEATSKLEQAANTFNEVKTQALGVLNDEVRAYNIVLDTVRDFVEGITSQLVDNIEEKSEKWQESDNGQTAIAFKDEWENFEIEPLDEIDVDDIEMFDNDTADRLSDLPVEPQ